MDGYVRGLPAGRGRQDGNGMETVAPWTTRVAAGGAGAVRPTRSARGRGTPAGAPGGTMRSRVPAHALGRKRLLRNESSAPGSPATSKEPPSPGRNGNP